MDEEAVVLLKSVRLLTTSRDFIDRGRVFCWHLVACVISSLLRIGRVSHAESEI